MPMVEVSKGPIQANIGISFSASTYIVHNEGKSISFNVNVSINGETYSFPASLTYSVAATDYISTSGSDTRSLIIEDV